MCGNMVGKDNGHLLLRAETCLTKRHALIESKEQTLSLGVKMQIASFQFDLQQSHISLGRG